MRERLEEILAFYNLNSSRLADKMGIQRSGISHIMAGRNKPSYDFLTGILEVFPEINGHWLLTGEGEMITDDENNITNTDNNELSTNKNPQTDLFNPANLKEESIDPDKNRKHKEQSEVYKSKQNMNLTDTQDDEVVSVIILLKNGKFRHYRAK